MSRSYDCGLYERRQCHHNSVALAKAAAEHGFPIEESRIVLMRPRGAALYAAETRNGPAGWSKWHAALEHRGYILDLDYPAAEPVPASDYFHLMFNRDPGSPYWTELEDIQVKAVPAPEFIRGEASSEPWFDPVLQRVIQRRKNHLWYLSEDREHEWMSAEEFARRHDPFPLRDPGPGERPMRGAGLVRPLPIDDHRREIDRLWERGKDFDRIHLLGWEAGMIDEAKRIAALGIYETKWIGQDCAGLGVCDIYAIARVLGVRGATPSAFFDGGSPYTRAAIFADGYVEPVATPAPGDLVSYRRRGRFEHMGIYRGTRDGHALVESKFGIIPAVFLHRLEDVPSMYGDEVVFYRPLPALEELRRSLRGSAE